MPSYTIIPPGFPGNQVDNEQMRTIQNYDPDLARNHRGCNIVFLPDSDHVVSGIRDEKIPSNRVECHR